MNYPETDPAADYFPACDVCGVEAGTCECPECPVCGAVGDWECYGEHMDGNGQTLRPGNPGGAGW